MIYVLIYGTFCAIIQYSIYAGNNQPSISKEGVTILTSEKALITTCILSAVTGIYYIIVAFVDRHTAKELDITDASMLRIRKQFFVAMAALGVFFIAVSFLLPYLLR